jgi:hypothetical protein
MKIARKLSRQTVNPPPHAAEKLQATRGNTAVVYRPLARQAGIHLKHPQLINRSGSIDDRSPWAAVGGTVPGGGSRRVGTAARETEGVDLPGGGWGVAAAFEPGMAAAVGFPAVGGVAAAAAAVAAGEAAEVEYSGWSLVTQWPKRCDSRATPFFLCRSGALHGEKDTGGRGKDERGGEAVPRTWLRRRVGGRLPRQGGAGRGSTMRWPSAGAKWRPRLSKEGGAVFCARGDVLRVRVGAVLVRGGAGADVLLRAGSRPLLDIADDLRHKRAPVADRRRQLLA